MQYVLYIEIFSLFYARNKQAINIVKTMVCDKALKFDNIWQFGNISDKNIYISYVKIFLRNICFSGIGQYRVSSY